MPTRRSAGPSASALKPLVRRLEQNPWFRDSFDNLPYSVERVELDRLVASQIHVERAFTQAVPRAARGDERGGIVPFLPAGRQAAAAGHGHPALRRPLRLHLAIDRLPLPFAAPVAARGDSGSRQQRPDQRLCRHRRRLRLELPERGAQRPRICLQNGYHRAYALRCAGLKYAYCVVEDVTRKDELKLTADDTVTEDPEFYFASQRPPLIKDFFDRRLARKLRDPADAEPCRGRDQGPLQHRHRLELKRRDRCGVYRRRVKSRTSSGAAVALQRSAGRPPS